MVVEWWLSLAKVSGRVFTCAAACDKGDDALDREEAFHVKGGRCR